MQRQPSSRDILIDRVRQGDLTPEDAEQEAERQGFGPLARKPPPTEFNPDKMHYWSLPMALAWIAWRSSQSVREHCAEYRENYWEWVPVSWNVQTNDANGTKRIDGYELRAMGLSTACRLPILEKPLRARKELPSTAKLTVSQAVKQLFAKLAAGQIIASAKNAFGQVVDIPQREWPYLRLFEERERDVLKYDPLDKEPAFTEINLPRDRLKVIWQESPIEPYMIEPMMRQRREGYVSLCSALHWIMTEAGRKVGHLDDTQSWDAAVARLIPLISTGEVEIIGRDTGGQPKTMDGVMFAGISVGQPLRESFRLIAGDNPWISCTPYVDEECWGRDFNDHMYLKRFGPASWTHLQVRKADVLRHITFEADANDAANGDALAMPDESGGQSFKAEDAVLVEEMRALIKAGKAKGAGAAALRVVSKAKKLGSDDSAVERLRRAYGRKYPTRKRL
jgi:hypothetical protein